jgi:hypothetical protein
MKGLVKLQMKTAVNISKVTKNIWGSEIMKDSMYVKRNWRWKFKVDATDFSENLT